MKNEEKDFGGKERRKFPRLPASVVEYSLEKKGVNEKTSFARDISAGGLCIFVSEKIEMNTMMSLKIYLPENKEAIEAVGRVVWVRRSALLKPEAKHYDLGIELIKVDKAAQKRIYEYSEKTFNTKNPS